MSKKLFRTSRSPKVAHIVVRKSDAARAIEWNDSCDGDQEEREKILKCLERRDKP